MFSKELKREGKKLALDMFYHGYDNYMQHAFPDDELRPISCQGDNEMFGGLALSLIDSIDMLGIAGNATAFTEALWKIVDNVDFDKDKVVSVFEMNIRVLGGLLSAHIMARDDSLGIFLETCKHSDHTGSVVTRRYNDELLDLAEDLARRLLVAFQTPTGIPYGSVNLRHGVAKNETPITCTAGGGSFLIEFGVLSRLTHNASYDLAARHASHALWERRSELNLVGAHINVLTGAWSQIDAGIGTFIDSYYEYMLKSYIMFGKEEDLLMFIEGYTAVVRFLKRGPWYIEANMNDGNVSHPHFTSLQGFWPGLQVLYGDVDMASDTLRAFLTLTDAYTFPPERFNIKEISIEFGFQSYPLRPEFIESMYYLYTATKSKEWLEYGMDMLLSMSNATRVECGVASVRNVTSYTYESATDALEDKMPSYFLAETSKYFYLLFDEENEYMGNRNVIFSTEGHPFPIGSHLHRFSRTEDCPIAKEEVATAPSAKGSRADYFHWSIEKIRNRNASGGSCRAQELSHTSWEYYAKSEAFKTTQTEAVDSYLFFSQQPCRKPSILEFNPLIDRLYDPLQYEDFKCWPEEGKYVSDSSPPFSYVKGHSPFTIVAPFVPKNNHLSGNGVELSPRYMYQKLLHKTGMSDADLRNFLLYIFLFMRIISVCILHRQR